MFDGEALHLLDKLEALKEIGGRIKAKRESLGLSVQEVQERTKIRTKYLLAVEEGNDSISPGKAYFRAFLKTYANFLGLDGTRLSKEYWSYVEQEESLQETHQGLPSHKKPPETGNADKGQTLATQPPSEIKNPSREALGKKDATQKSEGIGEEEVPSSLRHRPRRRKKGRNTFAIALILLSVAALVLGAWFLSGRLKPSPKPSSPEISDGNPPKEPVPPQTAPKTPLPPEINIVKTEPNNATTIWEIDKGPLALAVNVSTDGSCWVRVEIDGKPFLEETLLAGSKKEFRGEKEIKIRAGRPWDLKITLNGKDLGAGGVFGPVKDLIFRVKS